MADGKKKILFVCLGNICRSPSAGAILKHLIKQREDREEWEIDSAGIIDMHAGKRSDQRGLKVLKQHGIPNDHRARQVCREDFDRFDLILAFDESNVEDLDDVKPSRGNVRAEVKLFGSFDPHGERIIDDPYYGNMSGFEKMFDHIYRCCVEFLKQYK